MFEYLEDEKYVTYWRSQSGGCGAGDVMMRLSLDVRWCEMRVAMILRCMLSEFAMVVKHRGMGLLRGRGAYVGSIILFYCRQCGVVFIYWLLSHLRVTFKFIRIWSSISKTQAPFFSTGSINLVSSGVKSRAAAVPTERMETSELADVSWENLGFGLIPTDYMYIAKCSRNGPFDKGELQPFGNIELSPSAGILNYGQGIFEGLKAYRAKKNSILLFRPEENAQRIIDGAERMCMPSPTKEQFLEAVKLTVLANKRWVPPLGKGSLYIRPLLMGTGAVLGLAPSPEYTFLVYVSPVGNYFKGLDLTPIHLVVENDFHRAAPGGTGGIKTIGNYASVLKAQSIAKAKGFHDVLYLDSVNNKYLEEVSSCNIFIIKDKVISTPGIKGTILPGITRKSIIDVARSLGYQVEERPVSVDDLLEADEVFCTGTAVVVSPVGSVTSNGKRVEYKVGGDDSIAQQLYATLTNLQMGVIEDKMGWTLEIN